MQIQESVRHNGVDSKLYPSCGRDPLAVSSLLVGYGCHLSHCFQERAQDQVFLSWCE